MFAIHDVTIINFYLINLDECPKNKVLRLLWITIVSIVIILMCGIKVKINF